MATQLPTQETADFKKPEQHFAWALRNLPTFAGVGTVTHEGFIKQWSEHLVLTGAVHVDYLRTLADENGNIHVSQLPKQSIKWQPPFRGQRHGLNTAARWVPIATPDIKPFQLQDVSKLTIQEQHAMARQVVDLGLIPDTRVGRDNAQVIND